MRVIVYDPDPRMTLTAAVEHAITLGLPLTLGDRVLVRNPRGHKPGEREPADVVIVPEAYRALAQEYVDAGVRAITVLIVPHPASVPPPDPERGLPMDLTPGPPLDLDPAPHANPEPGPPPVHASPPPPPKKPPRGRR